jgi:conjugative transfer signal peptidase TraF
VKVGKLKLQTLNKILLATVLVVGPVVALSATGFSLNTTACIPVGLYETVSKPIAVGHLATSCISLAATRQGLIRGYLDKGSTCYGISQPLIKYIAAGAGSVVRETPDGVWINGKKWPMSKPLLHDTAGRPLHPYYGVHILKKGQFWVMGLNKLAWDSRYYGPVSSKDLLKRQTQFITIKGM